MLYAAQNASTFTDSLGVNTHLSARATPYADLSQVTDELNYLGIHNLRDDFALNTRTFDSVGALMAQGFEFDLISSGGNRFVDAVHNLQAAHPGGVIAVEGLNEVDGRAGRNDFASDIANQQNLFTSVRADPALANVSVYNLTVAVASASVGLGDLSPYADFANVHIYYGAGMPAYGRTPNDSTLSWSNWLNSGQLDAPGRPTVVTETGSAAAPAWDGGVDENTQARQILNSLMDSAKTGVAATYIYQLVDSLNRGANDPESNYGLFRWDGSARPAAAAVHNLVQILDDGSAGGGGYAVDALDYTIQGVPQWGGHLLFQEGDGTKDIVVWAEPDIWNETTKTAIAPPNTPVTIDLATPASVSIYDPVQGAGPVQTLGITTHLTLNVTDHPLVIEVKAATYQVGGDGPDTLADLAGTSYLRGADGDDSIQGGSGFDDINGNKGNDTIDGGSGGGGWLVGGQGNDLITSHAGNDVLNGNQGSDTLNGGSGDEILRGGQGDDALFGGAGADWLSGDRGNDTLTGGPGADTFHTFSGGGIDRVTDFNPTEGDRVHLDPGTAYTLFQAGADTVIDLGQGDEMILVGVQATTLRSGWIFEA